jgi:hypothetical protein
MKTPRLCFAAASGLAALLVLPAVAAPKPAARTEVVFFEPEKFTDASDRYLGGERDRDGILDRLKDYLIERADSRFVAEGQKLAVTITDVDLAGEFEPWHGPSAQDVRIVRDIYPPKINLAFRLTDANGEVLAQGQRELRDLAFMMSISINTSDSLRFEKALLDDWLRKEFSPVKKN